MAGAGDEFTLYDLRVEVVLRPGGVFVCGHREGEAFRVAGEDLVFNTGASVSFYALAALLPLLAAKQRVTELLESFGHTDVIDLGDLSTARGTESLLPIWVRLWGVLGIPAFQFKVVR